jgi:hypothetical protein
MRKFCRSNFFFSSALPWCGALGPSFCCPRTRRWRLVAALRLGGFGSPSSDPWLPLRTGSACSAFRFSPTRFPADLPLRCKAPRPERPIPPQTTHTPLPFSGLRTGHTAYNTVLFPSFSISSSTRPRGHDYLACGGLASRNSAKPKKLRTEP